MTKPNPAEIAGQQGVCPKGKYCPEGTGAPLNCPAGTYNDEYGAESLDECLPCPVGKYCNVAGATMASLILAGAPSYGTCTAGYVCFEGSTTPTPTDGVQGIQCLVGNYCPAGTPAMIECPAGSYQDVIGQATCKTCPATFYCNENGMSIGTACPTGSYCPAGSTLPVPCP